MDRAFIRNYFNGENVSIRIVRCSFDYKVYFRQADLLIGGMDYDRHVRRMLGRTKSYIQDDQTWCVSLNHEYETWKNLFALLTLTVAISTVLMGVVFVVVMHYFRKVLRTASRSDISSSWIIMCSMYFGGNATYKAKGAAVKMLLVIISIYAISFSALISNRLIKVLTRPRHSLQIDTISQAHNNGYRFIGGNVALTHILENVNQVGFIIDPSLER